MEASDRAREIVICLGSSCFARGNSGHLAAIKDFLSSRGIEASVRFSGLLCQDECKLGPNISIGGQAYHEVTSERLLQLLEEFDQTHGGRDGKA